MTTLASRDRLIVALDVPSAKEARALVERIGDAACFYKVGLELFSAGGYFELIEWLAGEKAQHMYADINYEYPIRSGITINPIVASYGTLKADSLPLSKIADNKKAASTLVDKVGFNN